MFPSGDDDIGIIIGSVLGACAVVIVMVIVILLLVFFIKQNKIKKLAARRASSSGYTEPPRSVIINYVYWRDLILYLHWSNILC